MTVEAPSLSSETQSVITKLEEFRDGESFPQVGTHLIEIAGLPSDFLIRQRGDDPVRAALSSIRNRASRREFKVIINTSYESDKEVRGAKVLKIYINFLKK